MKTLEVSEEAILVCVPERSASEDRDWPIQMHFPVLDGGFADPMWTNPTPFVSMD
jgi:hypothetical protein